ncbi:MAG: molybdopterin-synthase adenylyltransferase MoeB [Chloroflexi bacterium]|nr:molybdopterin-synthase adenylyltransferase MoeB [Chloroflexota bacterium]
MAVSVYIPTPFRQLTGNQNRVEVEAVDIADLLNRLDERFPGMKRRVTDEHGLVYRFVNIYVNDTEIGDLGGIETPLKPGDQVAVIPAMAGGAVAFTAEQVTRYSRHLILPEIGGTGQRRLLGSKVALIGAGGLGSPAALYLAAAGVGTLGIVDFDVVDLSNLQRQLLHHGHDVGRLKVDSAAETLNDINPGVTVVKHPVALTSENAMEILGQYDAVVNGCDNFATRYLVNDACYLLGKPLIDGSIFRFEGQASVYIAGSGCYRCLFPSPPPPGAVPNCAEAGVLGVLPGIVGCIQAIESIKVLLELGEPLVGRLLLFDALTMEFRQVKLRRDPNCPLCGDNPTVHELIDYDQFCGAPTAAHA